MNLLDHVTDLRNQSNLIHRLPTFLVPISVLYPVFPRILFSCLNCEVGAHLKK